MTGKNPLEEAKILLAADMERFGITLESMLETQKNYLSAEDRETYRRGKKLRPVILLLTAHLFDGGEPVPEKVIKAAVSLEMLHMATLIHDDIIDRAPVRRGLHTVYADRGMDKAILLGDMQFIQSIRCFVDGINAQEDMSLVKLVLDTGFKICCGELDEMDMHPDQDNHLLESRYFRTIDRKTATLFGLACEAGAALMSAGSRECYYASHYGKRLGRAFQIMDDILDFTEDEAQSGKARGTDILQRRFSLPIIYTLQETAEEHILARIMKGERFTPEEFREALDTVLASEGITRAYAKARELAAAARAYLDYFPASPARDLLAAIARFVVDRGTGHFRSRPEKPETEVQENKL